MKFAALMTEWGGCAVQARRDPALEDRQPVDWLQRLHKQERKALQVTCWRDVEELTQAECPEEVAIFPSNVMAYLKTPRGLPVTARCSNACSTKSHGVACADSATVRFESWFLPLVICESPQSLQSKAGHVQQPRSSTALSAAHATPLVAKAPCDPAAPQLTSLTLRHCCSVASCSSKPA